MVCLLRRDAGRAQDLDAVLGGEPLHLLHVRGCGRGQWDPRALGGDGEGTHEVLDASGSVTSRNRAWSQLTATVCGMSRGLYTAAGAATIG